MDLCMLNQTKIRQHNTIFLLKVKVKCVPTHFTFTFNIYFCKLQSETVRFLQNLGIFLQPRNLRKFSSQPSIHRQKKRDDLGALISIRHISGIRNKAYISTNLILFYCVTVRAIKIPQILLSQRFPILVFTHLCTTLELERIKKKKRSNLDFWRKFGRDIRGDQGTNPVIRYFFIALKLSK